MSKYRKINQPLCFQEPGQYTAQLCSAALTLRQKSARYVVKFSLCWLNMVKTFILKVDKK